MFKNIEDLEKWQEIDETNLPINEKEELNRKIEKITSLTKFLNFNAMLYYNGKEPYTSDEAYDATLRELEMLENETGFRLENSPTKKVGYEVLNKLQKKILPRKMLSLDKIKNDIDKVKKWIGKEEVMMTLKLDGLSCMLEYKKGKLVGCYTRGNGTEGTNVTEMVKKLPSIQNVLGREVDLLILGEIIIRKDKFDKINRSRVKNGENEFANPRNLASGTLLSLDTSLGVKRHLEFIAFDYIGNLYEEPYIKRETQSCKISDLRSLIFNVPSNVVLNTVNNIEEEINKLKNISIKENYPIDGIVISYNKEEKREKCKPTEKFPTHSIAFKFEDEFEETVLLDVEWSMSRTGILTPIAIFETVEIDGTSVSRASLHNLSMVKLLELGIGDIIKVTKANQIIPQVIGNKTRSNNLNVIEKCPHCDNSLEIIGENSFELVCKNNNCSQQQLLKINHFLSKDALNTKGLSEKILSKLMKYGEIKDIYDVLNLPNKREYLIKKNYPTLGRKVINNICEAIQSSCNTTLDRFIIGLGIDGVGKKVAKDISKRYKNIENLMNNISIDNLKTINGISDSARTIYRGFMDSVEHIENLLKYIEIENIEKVKSSGLLEGKVFVFTGKTDTFKNRKEVELFIELNGGVLASSVSKNTSFLICNSEENSSKYKKAKELSVEIITDKQLKDMVN